MNLVFAISFQLVIKQFLIFIDSIDYKNYDSYLLIEKYVFKQIFAHTLGQVRVSMNGTMHQSITSKSVIALGTRVYTGPNLAKSKFCHIIHSSKGHFLHFNLFLPLSPVFLKIKSKGQQHLNTIFHFHLF